MTVEAGEPSGGEVPDPTRAWAPYEPDARRPWDLARASHLFRRAAFGASWGELQAALAEGPARAIDRLLRPPAGGAAIDRAQEGYEDAASDSKEGLRAWWLRRMAATPHPLLEKMTLFWHGHFAADLAKVKSARLLHRYVGHIRRHSLGSFDALLQGIVREPAVLLSLDAGANRRARPAERFARVLLERYSLGEGRFTDGDVRETARAFTGWFVLREELRWIPREHDGGVKKVLGQEGDFTGEGVVRILLRQPAAARLVVRKLYRWLIDEVEEPAEDLIAPLLERFGEDRDIAKLVETMLRSNRFFSEAVYRRRIKGPVEFALGIVKALEGIVATGPLGSALEALGQDLCRPPAVKGWEGGGCWINWSTILARSNLARALLLGEEPYGDRLDPLAAAGRHGHAGAEAAGRFLVDLLLAGDVEEGARRALMDALLKPDGPAGEDGGRRLRRFVHLVVTQPEFHLA